MESLLSNRVKSFPASGIRRIFDLASQPGVISLAVGEPDFDTPSHIRETVKQSLDRGETHYSANLGLAELRGLIAEQMAKKSGHDVDPAKQVIVTIGGVEALYLAVTAVLDPGDEILIPALWCTTPWRGCATSGRFRTPCVWKTASTPT